MKKIERFAGALMLAGLSMMGGSSAKAATLEPAKTVEYKAPAKDQKKKKIEVRNVGGLDLCGPPIIPFDSGMSPKDYGQVLQSGRRTSFNHISHKSRRKAA